MVKLAAVGKHIMLYSHSGILSHIFFPVAASMFIQIYMTCTDRVSEIYTLVDS